MIEGAVNRIFRFTPDFVCGRTILKPGTPGKSPVLLSM